MPKLRQDEIGDPLGRRPGRRVFRARHRHDAADAVSRVIPDLFVALERHAAVANRRGHDAAMHERHVVRRQVEGREGVVQFGDERGDVGRVEARVGRVADVAGFPGAEQCAAPPRHEEQIASRAPAAAERFIARLAPRDQIHRLQHRDA